MDVETKGGTNFAYKSSTTLIYVTVDQKIAMWVVFMVAGFPFVMVKEVMKGDSMHG